MAFSDRQYNNRNYGGFSMFPPVIKGLLFSNAVIFLLQVVTTPRNAPWGPLVTYGGLWPIHEGFMVWQPITYMFLHGSLGHIAINMLVLWMFGVQLENQWGSKKFLIYYLICGLGGAAAQLAIGPLLNLGGGPLIGASAGVFGVLIAFGLMFPDQYIYMYFLLPIKAKYFVPIYIIIELMAVGSMDNVGHLAHLGGAAIGVIYILIDAGGSNVLRNLRGNKRSNMNAWNPPQNNPGNRFSGSTGGFFKRPRFEDDEPVEAEYYDVGGRKSSNSTTETRKGRVITQEEVDRILDKIAASGYQNLTNEEREILFEASRKMDEKH